MSQEKWFCTVCGYIHEGELHEEYVCPVCKKPAVMFEKISDGNIDVSKYAGSKTEVNLWDLFTGKSRARNRYTFYAQVAEGEGYSHIADIFLETARNEQAHARIGFKELGNIRNTSKNLLAAAENEKVSSMVTYSRYAKEAKEEGFEDIANIFNEVAAIEKAHEERFRKLWETIESHRKGETEGQTMWKCRVCGHIIIDKKAPLICPVCNYSKSYFEVRSEEF